MFTDLNVYALVICNVLFPVIVSVLNCRSITTEVGYEWEYKETFLKPLYASVAMGFVAFAVYQAVSQRISNIYVSCIAAIVPAVLVYGVTVIQIGCFSEEELLAIPGGAKLARFLPY